MAEEAFTAPELREKLKESGDRLRDLRERKEDERSAEWSRDIRQTTDIIYSLDAELKVLEAMEPPEARGATAANGTQERSRSVGQQFTESDEYRDRSGANSAEFRALLADADLTAGAGLFVPRGTPFLGNVRQRRLWVRDLLSVQQTGLTSIPYIRENNAAFYEGGASAVEEGSVKPEVSALFTAVDAPVRKIAAWIPVTQEVIDDTQTLMGYIDNRLLYMLKIREEAEVLNGSGTSPDITGILQSSPQTQAQVTASDYQSTIGAAIGKIENVDGYADGIVMNPIDYWSMITSRHSTFLDASIGGGSLPYGAPAGGILGLPVVRTRGMASGKVLVGDFGQGATLYDKAEANIRTTDSHSDYFIYNKTVILAEERIALSVFRPDFFVDTSL